MAKKLEIYVSESDFDLIEAGKIDKVYQKATPSRLRQYQKTGYNQILVFIDFPQEREQKKCLSFSFSGVELQYNVDMDGDVFEIPLKNQQFLLF